MKTLSPGLVFFTRRKRGGGARLVADAAVCVADLRPAADFLSVLTSRPMYAGADRRQLVRPGQFLNFEALATAEKSAAVSPLAGAVAS